MRQLRITDVRVRDGDSGFLLDDGEVAILCDSGFGFTGRQLAENIRKRLGGRPLDYIFLTHSHYDHVLGSAHVRKLWPEVRVVAGSHAAQVFARPTARNLMAQLDRKHAMACGVEAYEDLVDALRVDLPVRDGDVIRAGSMEFTAVELPGHTRCSLGFFCKDRKLLLGTETLGVYNSKDDVVPSYLVGYEMTLDSLEKARKLEPEAILVPHYGVLEGEKARFYLKKGMERAVDVAHRIRKQLCLGLPKEQIAAEFMDSIRHGYIHRIYPEDAMVLNTRIMIDLLEKELCHSFPGNGIRG